MTNRTNPSPLPHLFVSVVLSAILLGLSLQYRFSPLTKPVNFLFTPLRQPFFTLHQQIAQTLDFLRQLPHLSRQVKDLKRQNTVLATQAQENLTLKVENQVLRKAVNSPSLSQHTLLPTKVIGLSRYAYLNQGSAASIQPGQAVVADNQALLGIILETTTLTSKVQLLTDHEANLAAITLSGTNGQVNFLDTHLQLTKVAQKDPLTSEEPIFAKPSELIPEHLLIGTLTQVNDTPTSVYKTALIQPAATIHDQQIVLVILR